MSMFKWLRLVKAARPLYRKYQRTNVRFTDQNELKVVMKDEKVPIANVRSRDLYNWIVLEKTKNTLTVPKCVKYINVADVDTSIWAKIYIRASVVPVDTKTKEFQYRFLNNILVNKYWLCKWKLKEDDQCNWCNDGTEDLLHVFWECSFAIQLWHSFEEWCKDMHVTEHNLTKHDVFFGVDDKLLCTLIFAAKRHLCRKFCGGMFQCWLGTIEGRFP